MNILEQLIANPKNPRRISPEKLAQLRRSLKEFSKMLRVRPIVYDETFLVLGGNQRITALKELQVEGFEIEDSFFSQVFGWTEEEKERFIIQDNHHWAEWDIDMMREHWSEKPLEDWGLDFAANWKKSTEEEENKNKEINPDNLLEHGIACPKCGFEFEAPEE